MRRVYGLTDADRERIGAVIDRNLSALRRPGFVAARPGYPISHGWVVRDPAIVISVDRKLPPDQLAAAELYPARLDGMRVDVVPAHPLEILAAQAGSPDSLAAAGRLGSAAAQTHYQGLPGNPIDREFVIEKPVLCHASPDAGWPTLRRFLEGARDSLAVAMYDFNATHVSRTLTSNALAHDVSVRLVIDDGLAADERKLQSQLEAKLKQRYTSAIARTGNGRRFSSAYHEKVAVRDRRSFWLSSGNWSRASQPDLDPVRKPQDAPGMYSKGNRDWHVVVEDADLAKVFQQYIEFDLEKSQSEAGLAQLAALPDLLVPEDLFFDLGLAAQPVRPVAPESLPAQEPVRVRARPLLTPDNYIGHMTELIRSARTSLYLQFQYIRWSDLAQDAAFRGLLEAVRDKCNDPAIDTRIIVGNNDAARDVARLAEAGFDDARFRVQSRVHNKGVIVDGEVVAVGSHNWSGDGTLRNRDATLLLHNRAIAAYFTAMFQDDWERRAKREIAQLATPLIATRDQPTPAGMVRVPWHAIYG